MTAREQTGAQTFAGVGRTSIPFDGRLGNRKNVKNNPRPFEELPPEIRELILNKKSKTKAADTMQILGEKHVLSVLLYLEKEFRKGIESGESEGWISEESLRAKYS